MAQPPRRYTFRQSHRLGPKREFSAVFENGIGKSVGPLRVLAIPNHLPHPRLGLTVPRRVGNAVKRNRIKRLLREAFRLQQHDWPRGYDIVVLVRPHKTFALVDYQKMLATAVRSIDLKWENRRHEGTEARRHEGGNGTAGRGG